MSRLGASAALLCALALLTACASPAPGPRVRTSSSGVHVVRRGETLWRISQAYGTSVDALARLNGLRDPTRIGVGQRLRLPAGSVRSARNGRGTRPSSVWTSSDPRGASGRTRFVWPAKGRLTSRFGVRGGAHHDGIDISVGSGAAVRAAASGRVIHSDASLAGYGNMVIIKHRGDLSSVYAHNRRNLARVGDFVEPGQVIAEAGQTGRATSPHVHFEIRRDGKPIDPLDYLP